MFDPADKYTVGIVFRCELLVVTLQHHAVAVHYLPRMCVLARALERWGFCYQDDQLIPGKQQTGMPVSLGGTKNERAAYLVRTVGVSEERKRRMRLGGLR